MRSTNASPNRCRFCLFPVETTNSALPVSNLKEKFLYVTGIICKDEQPQVVCSICKDELENAFKFKKKCEEIEKQLLQEKVKLEMVLEDFAQSNAVEEFFNDVSDELIKREEGEPEVENDVPLDVEEEPNNVVENTERSELQKSKKNNRKIKCEVCGHFYLNFTSIKTHYAKQHDNIKPYHCSQCNQHFHVKTQLESHKNNKCGTPRQKLSKPKSVECQPKEFISCAICNNAYTTTYLPVHLREIHGKLPKGLTCDICNEKFKRKPNLIEHMKRKHMASQFECSFCNVKFPTSGMKRTHEIRYHTFQFSQHCRVCDLKFVSAAEYRRHVTVHTGEMQFECSDCGKTFARKQNMKTHLLTHSQRRAFKCQNCGASFKTPVRLKVHLQSHQDKNYECPVCKNMFITNQSLRRHVTKIHPTYKLPPLGTIMNKKSLEKILNLAKHLKIKVSEGKLTLPQLYEAVGADKLNAKSMLRTTIIS